MAVDVEEMRWRIMKAYPGTDWLAECDAMTENQVRAAYVRFIDSGRIKIKEKK